MWEAHVIKTTCISHMSKDTSILNTIYMKFLTNRFLRNFSPIRCKRILRIRSKKWAIDNSLYFGQKAKKLDQKPAWFLQQPESLHWQRRSTTKVCKTRRMPPVYLVMHKLCTLFLCIITPSIKQNSLIKGLHFKI